MKMKVVFVHLIGWISFLLYSYTYWLGKDFDTVTLWVGISMDICRVVQFYFCYLLVYPLFLRMGKWWQLLLGIVGAFFLFIGLRAGIEEVVYPLTLGFHNYYEGTTIAYYILDNIYYAVPFIVLSAAVFFTQSAFAEVKRNKLLKEEAIKAELAFLRAQINPHFLYNALNYMYSLAIPVSDELARAIVKLSDIMRYTFSESKDGKVELGKEVQYAQAYVDLLRMRFAPGFYVQWEVGELPVEVEIAPLLLIPFVENALKHGVINDPQRPIKVKLVYANGKLTLTVNNKIGQQQKDRSSGVGLANVKRRLALIYPDRHQLLVSNNGRSYRATLTIEIGE